MGSETLPSACYILSDESSMPFYSTSNGYNNLFRDDNIKTRKNAIVEYLDYQILVTQLNGDMQAAKRD